MTVPAQPDGVPVLREMLVRLARPEERPRDRWLGWHKALQFRNLHWIAKTTRFLVLPARPGVANLPSRVLGQNLRRLGGDWRERWGYALEQAETFVDPQLYWGTCYRAANWIKLGLSRGYARSNG